MRSICLYQNTRIESISKMAAQQGVYFLKSHDHSGHSIGTNQESYLEQNILELTLAGVYTYNRFVDATLDRSHPRFHYLVHHTTEQAR